MMQQQIKVLIVDEKTSIRKGLIALIQTAHDMTVVSEAVNGSSAVYEAIKSQPDVIVMDLIKADRDGIEFIKAIKRAFPPARILILTNFSDQQRVIAAFQAGAQGYLLKDAVMTDVVEAIRDIYDGKLTLHPTLTDFFIEAIQEPAIK